MNDEIKKAFVMGYLTATFELLVQPKTGNNYMAAELMAEISEITHDLMGLDINISKDIMETNLNIECNKAVKMALVELKKKLISGTNTY